MSATRGGAAPSRPGHTAQPGRAAHRPPGPARLQAIGVLSGFAAGAWLGAAEAPTKLVTIGVPPVVVSLLMVIGVFLARWSLPALLQGTAGLRDEVRRAPHLVLWAAVAGALWSVANTLTVFAIRDIGLSIAFPLWNTNSLLGILWGFVFFNELRGAGRRRWLGVVGGAVVMFAGATLLAVASSGASAGAAAARGSAAALAAGLLWGTMYIPYRKAYISGMSPLAFIAFFTIGEIVTMGALAITLSGGVRPLATALAASRDVAFWILLGGFVWVIGDLFQQYAAKYAGISRGIPLSNTNQLWGLLWGFLVFGELRSAPTDVRTRVVEGSVLMAIGAAAIAFSTAGAAEQRHWGDAAEREIRRYGLDPIHVHAGRAGRAADAPPRRGWLDAILVLAATAVFAAAALVARPPGIAVDAGWIAFLLAAMLALLVGCGALLWRATRFR